MSIVTQRLTPALGAVVTLEPGTLLDGADIVDPVVADELHAALMEHQVLFLPRALTTPAELVALARGFGPLAARHHVYPTLPDYPDVVQLDWDGENPPDSAEWHSDLTYRANPPFASVLRAVHLPPLGGDTLWASMTAVYESLSDALRSELVELEAVHDLGAFRSSSYQAGGLPAMTDAIAGAGASVLPVISHHPYTGLPYLNVSEAFTRFVIGYNAPESQRLLTYLFDLINRPQFHVRLRWEPDTVAIWDNYGTQHYAVADYMPHRRVMQRVVVASDARLPQTPSEMDDRSASPESTATA